jgi:hypothetical protein
MTRCDEITRAIQGHDRDLYAKKVGSMIQIFRKCKEYRRETLDHGITLWNLIRNDWLVMSLTDTWGARGKPVEWGILPIMARIKALDLWNSDNVSKEFFEQEEKDEKSKERDFKNNVESFLYDFRSQFAKATNDINTSTLNKIDKRRLGEKKWQS